MLYSNIITVNDIIMHNTGILSVSRLAEEKISPLVKKMEQESKFDSSIIDALFKNGVSTDSASILYFFSFNLVKCILLPLFNSNGVKCDKLIVGLHCYLQTLLELLFFTGYLILLITYAI
jgi:hypothetical protein